MQAETKRDLTLEVANLYPSQGEWTEEDYFSLPDTNLYVELSEGKLIMPPHPTRSHQIVLLELAFRLRTFVKERNLGEVLIAPLPVRLWPGKIREPDIFFLSKEHSDRAGEKFYGVPDLIIEIISPNTERIDRVDKFNEYAKAGVKEYWLVDPEKKIVEVYTLKEGKYILLGKYSSSQVASSKILSGFKIKVKEIF